MLRWLAIAVVLGGCVPDAVEIRAQYRFTGEQTAGVLVQALPMGVLASVGGTIPDYWPDDAPPLLLTLFVAQRARVDFASGGGRLPGDSSAVRLRGVRAKAKSGANGPLLPEPAELLVYVGPQDARMPDDGSVLPIARGGWPASSAEVQLLLEPGAEGALREALKSSNQAAVTTALRVPLDTRRDPRRPRAYTDVDVFVDLELVP